MRLSHSNPVGLFNIIGLQFSFGNSSLILNQTSILQDTTPLSPLISYTAGTGVSTGSVELRLIAPGDDGTVNTAAAYIVSDNLVSILHDQDESVWVTSIGVNVEANPSITSTLESFIGTGLEPVRNYNFSIKTVDAESNVRGVFLYFLSPCLFSPGKWRGEA